MATLQERLSRAKEDKRPVGSAKDSRGDLQSRLSAALQDNSRIGSITTFDTKSGNSPTKQTGGNTGYLSSLTTSEIQRQQDKLEFEIDKTKQDVRQEFADRDSAYNRAVSASNQIDYIRSISAFDPSAQVDKILRQNGFASEDEMKRALSTSARQTLSNLKQERRDTGSAYYHAAGKEAGQRIANADPKNNNAYRDAVAAAIKAQAIEDKYRFGGWNNEATAEYSKAVQAKQAAVQKLLAAGHSQEDIDRALDYAVRQSREDRAAKNEAGLTEYAKEHPVAGFVASLGTNVVKGVDYVNVLAKSIGHSNLDNLEEYRPISKADMQFSGMTGALRGGVIQRIEDDIDNELLEAAAVFGAQTGMSIADSLSLALTVPALAPVILGTGAAADATRDAIDRGATNTQALLVGAAAGVAEMAAERFSIEKLLDPSKIGKSWVKETLKQAGVEASEEMVTEITNIISDAAIMANKSNWAMAKQQYMAQGMTEEQAAQKVLLDNIKSVGLAGLAGAVSGGVSGGAVNAVNLTSYRANPNAQTPTETQQTTAPAQTPTIEQKPTQESAPVQPGVVSPTMQESAQGATVADSARVGSVGQGVKTFSAPGLVRDANFKKASLSSKMTRELDAVGKVAGVEVRFAPEVVVDGKKGNAKYENGVITIALDAQNPVRTAFTHEIVHRIKEASPEVYDTLASFVSGHMQRGSLEALGEFYSEVYGTADVKAWTEEMVADAFGTMLNDSTVMDQFVQDNRTAAQKVRDAIHDFIAAIKRMLNGQNVRLSQEERSIFAELQTDLEGMEKALADALGAIDGNKNAATMSSEAKLSAMRKSGMDFQPDGQYNDFDKENLELRGEPANKPVDAREWHAFNRSFANQTMGMKRGEERSIVIFTDRNVFFVTADGYMRGFAEAKISADSKKFFEVREEYHVDTAGETPDSMAEGYADARRRHSWGSGIPGYAGEADRADGFFGEEQKGDAAGNLEENEGNYYGEEVELVPGSLMYDGDGHAYRVNEHGLLEEIKLSRMIAPEERAEVAKRMAELNKQYGTIKQGENPARDVSVPKRTAKDNKVSQTIRTVLEAGATPDEALPTIEKMVADGDFSYEVYGDKKAIKDAENFVKHRGWGDATREWFDRMKKGEVSKKNTAIGWTLYNNAVNSKDMETAIDILNAMVEHQRNAAQAVQATRILKKMSPEGQLYAAQKSVQRLQEELNERYGKKTDVELKIDPALAEELMEAEDQKARDKVLQKIYKDIGRQIPSRFIDKWNAWRYLAMLGNPRTHVRNIVGNAFFAPVVATKNLTATAIESAVNRVTGGKTGRTKAVVGFSTEDKGRLKVAWADYADVAEAAMDGGKYSDSANANKYIQEGRQIFGRTDQAKTKVGRAVSGTVGKGVEAARTFNSKALEAEDRWFSQPHYAAALASYCKANGITAEQMRNGGITDEARAYAIKEAQKATYRDTNMLSDIFGRIGRYEGKNKLGKAVSTVVEGILPFRKTPANILARGLEYSPIGLLKSISYDLVQVKNGNMNATQLIDNLSAGLTGTGLLALGAFLAAQGLVRGAGGDDKEKKEFEDLMGHQNYSLEIGGKSFTLDWLAPEALPFFVGVNLWEVGKESSDGRTLADWLTAISNVSEPMMEMSCLQSLNDVFDSVGYASSNGLSGLTSAVASAATSYLTQGIPTLLGQFERSAQDIRMTTYTDKNKKNLTGDMQYAIGSASGKIPGYDYNQIAYIDAWGRTESTGSVLARVINNMANPSYVSTVDESKMEKELMRLYNATSDPSVFPNRASKYFSVDGKRIDLNGAQYVSYAKKKGQTAYNLLADLTKSSAYAKLTDTDKAKAVGLVYDYANAVAKAHVSSYELEGWIRKADKSRDVVSYILKEKVGK